LSNDLTYVHWDLVWLTFSNLLVWDLYVCLISFSLCYDFWLNCFFHICSDCPNLRRLTIYRLWSERVAHSVWRLHRRLHHIFLDTFSRFPFFRFLVNSQVCISRLSQFLCVDYRVNPIWHFYFLLICLENSNIIDARIYVIELFRGSLLKW